MKYPNPSAIAQKLSEISFKMSLDYSNFRLWIFRHVCLSAETTSLIDQSATSSHIISWNFRAKINFARKLSISAATQVCELLSL